jgi:hypothetical protein
MPDEGGSLTKALMSAVLLRARQRRQLTLDLDMSTTPEAKEIEIAWSNASEKEKKARTIFAQYSLKPEEVAAEWEATQSALGNFADVERFVSRAMMRLGAALVPQARGGYAAPLYLAPDVLKERFQAEGLLEETASPKPLRIAFESRPRAGFLSVHRAHPLPSVLAETFLESALDGLAKQDNPATLPRCGVWECEGVETVVTPLLLRIRHRIDSRGRLGPQFAMAEEAAAIGFDTSTGGRVLAGHAAFALLEATSGNVPERVRDAQLAKAVAEPGVLKPALNAYAAERAMALAADHSRARQALGSRAGVKVEAVIPVDVIGLYVLMPRL